MNRFLLFIFMGLNLWSFLQASFELAEKAYHSRVYNFAIINYEKSLIGERDPTKQETARYRLADSYYQIGKWDEASKHAQEYLKSYPSGKWIFQVKYLQALVAIEKKNYTFPKNIVESLIQNFPDRQDTYKLIFTLAQIYQDEGRYKDSISLLEMLQGKFDSDGNYLKSRIHYLNKNYSKALDEIVKVKREELTFFSLEEAVDLQVEILLQLEKYQNALKIIEQFFYQIKDQKIKSKLFFYQSHVTYLEGDYPKAIILYKNYLDKEPSSFYRNEAVFFLALSYYQIEQPVIALEYISQLEDKTTEDSLSKTERARKDKLAYLIYQKLGRQEKLSEYLEKLLDPGSPEEIFAIKEKIKWLSINDYQEQDEVKLSTEMKQLLSRFEKLETNTKKKATFYNELAEFFFKNDKPDFNIFFSLRAYRSHPDSTYLIGLGDRLSTSEDYLRAIKVYESILKKSKGSQRHYILDAIGYAFFQEGEYLRSAGYYKENLEASDIKYKSTAWFYIGENYRLLQDYQNAKKYFIRFLNEFPQDERVALVHLNLGFIYYYGDKDYNQSLQSLDQALGFLSTSSEQVTKIGDDNLINLIFQLKFRCYLDLGKEKEAVEQLNKISKLEDSDLYYSNLLILAKFYFNRQNYSESLSRYYVIINSEAGDNAPSDEILERAYFERVLIKLKEESGREAFFHLQKLKERFPESDLVREAYLSVGDHFYSQKRWVSAETVYKDFEKYARSPEDRMYALYYLAFTRQAMGKNEEAYLNFFSLKKLGIAEKLFDSFYFDALFELGVYDFENEQLIEAKNNFQEIVDKSPLKDLKDKAQKNLDIIETMNDPDPYSDLKTVDEITKKINSVSAPSLKNQGYYLIAKIYYEAKNYKLAYQSAKKIAPLSPYFEEALVIALRSLFSLNDFEEVYAYGMQNYFLPGFSISGEKKEFFYYALAFASKKLDRKADYEKFIQSLRQEFPDTEYLKKIDE